MSFQPPVETVRGAALDKRETALAISRLGNGRSNATGSFTLTINVASTVVTDSNVASDSHIDWTPKTANAAAEAMYISAQTDGSFTLTHANNAQADRTFSYAIQG